MIDGIREKALVFIAEQARRFTGAEFGEVLLFSQTEHFEQLIALGVRGTYLPGAPRSFSIYEGVTGYVFRHGEPQLINDVTQSKEYFVTFAAESELAAPLKRGDAVLGVLNLESDIKGRFNQNHLQITEFLAELVVSALTSIDLAKSIFYDK